MPMGVYKRTVEARRKMGLASKGRVPWNKGKKGIYSEETLKKISESTKKAMNNEDVKNKLISSHIGLNTWMLGKHHSEETKKKMSVAQLGRLNTWSKGKCLSEETKKKISNSLRKVLASEEAKMKISKSYVGMTGKHHSDETKRKLRISVINRMMKKGIGRANYNPAACHQIDIYGKKHGYNFQHALNGGEYHIKELGYFVDGYDKNNNIVVEYYEKWHNKIKKMADDEKRKQEIINYLGCKFIELKEWENINAQII